MHAVYTLKLNFTKMITIRTLKITCDKFNANGYNEKIELLILNKFMCGTIFV